MSFFSKPKPQPTRADALAELRNTLRRAGNDAIDKKVHPRDVIQAFENAANLLRYSESCSTSVPGTGLYDVDRYARQTASKPKPAPVPRNLPTRGPASGDAEDVAAWLESCTRSR